jgi:hypothetical protein
MPGKNVTMIKNLVDENSKPLAEDSGGFVWAMRYHHFSDFAIIILRSALENNLLIETQLEGKRTIQDALLGEKP